METRPAAAELPGLEPLETVDVDKKDAGSLLLLLQAEELRDMSAAPLLTAAKRAAATLERLTLFRLRDARGDALLPPDEVLVEAKLASKLTSEPPLLCEHSREDSEADMEVTDSGEVADRPPPPPDRVKV